MENETTAALIGAVIGGGLTILGDLAQEMWRDSRRAEQLSHAIAGEVGAIIEVVEKRQYVENIKAYAQLAHAGQAEFMRVRVTKDYFPVTQSSLEHIGMLPAELPLLIPKFLTLANAALEDLEALAAGDWNECKVDELAESYDELAEVLEAALTAGRSLVIVVAMIYGSPHGRYPMSVQLGRFWRWVTRCSDRKNAHAT
jgi:hypothetical protein